MPPRAGLPTINQCIWFTNNTNWPEFSNQQKSGKETESLVTSENIGPQFLPEHWLICWDQLSHCISNPITSYSSRVAINSLKADLFVLLHLWGRLIKQKNNITMVQQELTDNLYSGNGKEMLTVQLTRFQIVKKCKWVIFIASSILVFIHNLKILFLNRYTLV